MTTEAVKTPYDDEIVKAIQDGAVVAWTILQMRAEGYRRGVADTEAQYAELVAGAQEVLAQILRLNEHQGIDIDYCLLETALAKLKRGGQ